MKPDICPGCDREAGLDEGYGLDPNCGECFEGEVDGAPLTQEETTAGWSPEPAWADWRDKHHWGL